MKRILVSFVIAVCACTALSAAEKPWAKGLVKVSDDGTHFVHADGTPFFMLGDTGWLLPEHTTREQAAHYLSDCAKNDYNLVLVQTINGVPAYNIYGRPSHPAGKDDFVNLDDPNDPYGYWDHMDYIIDTAAKNGIFIGMVCIWGNLVKDGLMNVDQARDYGKFLANRYADKPNIIWVVGGDIPGEIKTEVWDALGETLRANDPNHLITFHPRGRTTSARVYNDRDWLDFNTYQSGHRRYDQRMGNKDYPIPDGTEEDVWMYVDSALVHTPRKPVFDAEPSYEAIPKGLHDKTEPLWNDREVRRYGYWNVLYGCAGHVYGHNNIMQFAYPGISGAYFADPDGEPWWRTLDAPGRVSMKYMRRLMEAYPQPGRVPAQELIIDNGTRHARTAAAKGDGYAILYSFLGGQVKVDTSGISGKGPLHIYYMNPADGAITDGGEAKKGKVLTLDLPTDHDSVVILTRNDLPSSLTPEAPAKKSFENLTE